jgi:hypothetical protein
MAWAAKIIAHLGWLPGPKRCALSKMIGWTSAKLGQTKRTGEQPLIPNPHSHIHRPKLMRMPESSEERCDASDGVVAPSSVRSSASDAHPESNVHDDGGSVGGDALGRLLSNLRPGLDERWQAGDPGSPSQSPTVTDPVNKKKPR